jgi:hypothetical protein
VLSPLHIATRGNLGGIYARVTRGYLICPDPVPAFPQSADVGLPGLRAKVGVIEWTALQRAHALAGQTTDRALAGDIDTDRLVAGVEPLRALDASLVHRDVMVALLEDDVDAADVSSGRLVMVVSERAWSAEVRDVESAIHASIVDRPGEGGCST